MRGIWLLLLLSFQAQADLWVSEPRAQDLEFKDIEMVKPQAFTETSFGSFILESHVEMRESDHEAIVLVGLTKNFQLVQVAIYPDRKVARLLSGDLRVESFYLSPEGVLVGRGPKNRILVFDQRAWLTGATSFSITRRLELVAGVLALSGIGIQLGTGHGFESGLFWAAEAFIGVTLGLGLTLTGLQGASERNSRPSGLIPTGAFFRTASDLKRVARSYAEGSAAGGLSVPKCSKAFGPSKKLGVSDRL